MNAGEIREGNLEYNSIAIAREICAQLAELNETLRELRDGEVHRVADALDASLALQKSAVEQTAEILAQSARVMRSLEDDAGRGGEVRK